MKPEQLVPSLETCKKLKDFPETHFFYWHRPQFEIYVLIDGNMFFDELSNPIPAPTVLELLDALPSRIIVNGERYYLCLTKEASEEFFLYCAQYDNLKNRFIYLNSHENPAEALALLYIELKEKGII